MENFTNQSRMKNVILSSFFGLFSTLTLAQAPQLSASNEYGIGSSSLIYLKLDTALWSFSAGGSGPDVNWDFSAMQFDSVAVPPDTLFVLSPVGTPFYPGVSPADYAAANYCTLLHSGDAFSPQHALYSYYHYSVDSLAIIGSWADNPANETWYNFYPDPLRKISWPIAFNEVQNDTIERTFDDMSGSGYHLVKGTYAVHYDGYGTLITPDGIQHPNTVRLHILEDYIDSSALFGATTVHRESYEWISADEQGFLMRFEMNSVDSTLIETAAWQRPHITVGTSEYAVQQLSLFPNPAQTKVYFQLPELEETFAVTVFDLTGKEIMQIHFPPGVNQLDITHLNSGTYLMWVQRENRLYTSTLTKL